MVPTRRSGPANRTLLLDVQLSLDGGASFPSLVQARSTSVTSIHHPWPGSSSTAATSQDRSSRRADRRPFANRTSSEIAGAACRAHHDLTPRVSSTTTPVGRSLMRAEHDSIDTRANSAVPPLSGTSWLFGAARGISMCLSRARLCIFSQADAQGTDVDCLAAATGCDRSQDGEIADFGARYRGGREELELAAEQCICPTRACRRSWWRGRSGSV